MNAPVSARQMRIILFCTSAPPSYAPPSLPEKTAPLTKPSRLLFSPLSLYVYTGILLSVDNYYNLQLADTEEWIDGAMAGNLGEVLIR